MKWKVQWITFSNQSQSKKVMPFVLVSFKTDEDLIISQVAQCQYLFNIILVLVLLLCFIWLFDQGKL